MDYKTIVVANGWLEDVCGATPVVPKAELHPTKFDPFGPRSQCPTFGHYEDMDPQLNSYANLSDHEDYFSPTARPFIHASPFPTNGGSPSLYVHDHHAKVAKRRPSRPRAMCPCDESSSSSASPIGTKARIPHNQVERKYRHSLNAEMARLRVVIPKISEWDTDPGATLKPSKAMVLASAVKYIRELEKENNALKRDQRQRFN